VSTGYHYHGFLYLLQLVLESRGNCCEDGNTMSSRSSLSALSASSSVDEAWIRKKLQSANSTQESVQSLSAWALAHKTEHERIVAIWFKVLQSGT